MKVLESALFLVFGSSFLTFTAISFAVFQRAPTLSNPSLFVEAVGVAGAVFICLGARGLYRLHQAFGGIKQQGSSHTVA